MKILSKNIKQGEVKVLVENPDDIWFLNNIIDTGDIVKAKTVRKMKVTETAGAEKKAVFLAVEVEKLEYSPKELRVAGKITEGPEDVPRGSYHTISVEIGTRLLIVKKEWLKFQLDYLKEASETKLPKIIIAVFDREEAIFAKMTREGYSILSKIKGKVAKKAVDEKVRETFYYEIITKLEEYDKRFDLDKIIIASPAFWKEELLKVLDNEKIRKKIIQATCSSVSESAISEVLKRKETQEALRLDRISKEIAVVDELLTAIKKGQKAAYGIKEVKEAAEAGAVEQLMLADSLIRKTRETGKFKEIENIMRQAEKAKGKIWIISSEHDAGKKLEGLGGIGALLRYKFK